jgi:hypothetical protein
LAVLILDDLANIVAVSPTRQALNEDQRKAALDELLRRAGAVSGNPRSADNEQIDADLARECDDSACFSWRSRHFEQEDFVRLLQS